MQQRWSPCLRCQSNRVRYTPAVNRPAMTFVGGVMAVMALLGGFLLPCLWVTVPVWLIFLVVGLMSSGQPAYRCLDCQHRWAPPA